VQDQGPRPPSADERRTLDEQLEVERDRRRRVVVALVSGAEARPATTPPGPWGPLVAGLTLAAFVALIVIVATLIRASLPGAKPAPPRASPTVATTR